ncbi:hypothetical protein LY76DRAFT_251083 [Colletotrichum caudatum]|nr:hypothetical protein LY76DRAFT_251083 [Colletotrichum caudatum]
MRGTEVVSKPQASRGWAGHGRVPPNPVRAPGGWLNLGGEMGKLPSLVPPLQELSGFGRVSGGGGCLLLSTPPDKPRDSQEDLFLAAKGACANAVLARLLTHSLAVHYSRWAETYQRGMASTSSQEVAGSLEMRHKHTAVRGRITAANISTATRTCLDAA